jgi:peroxiredoxin
VQIDRHPVTKEVPTVRDDIRPGGTFPDYELTDHTETRRRLSELQGNDPMILLLSRGHYCPKDHQQHLELAANYPKIAVAYTQVVTISTDNIIESREFRASVGAQWTFLSDAGRKVPKDLDIQEYTDPYHDPMIPHTLVLKPGLVIHSIYNGYWFWGRPSFEDLRRDLREATRDIRPDWDLTTPDLRTAWEVGDRSMFYPDPDVQPVPPRLQRNRPLGQGPRGARPTAPRTSL